MEKRYEEEKAEEQFGGEEWFWNRREGTQAEKKAREKQEQVVRSASSSAPNSITASTQPLTTSSLIISEQPHADHLNFLIVVMHIRFSPLVEWFKVCWHPRNREEEKSKLLIRDTFQNKFFEEIPSKGFRQ